MPSEVIYGFAFLKKLLHMRIMNLESSEEKKNLISEVCDEIFLVNMTKSFL